MKAPAAALLLAAGLGLTGCLNLKPAKTTVRHFVLSAAPNPLAATAAAAAGAGREGGAALGLWPVSLPGYLDNKRLAVRLGAQEIEYHGTLLWGEPLAQGVQRVLAEHLAALGAGQVCLSDWRAEDVRVEVTVRILRFEPDTAGAVRLDADYRLHAPGGGALLHAGVARIEQPGPPLSEDPEGAVQAMSAALADLGRELAAAIRALPKP